jgi:crossover junction endodeoxyribonuclease RusA
VSDSILLTLPWPPTVNHYWGTKGKRRFVMSHGIAFRNAVTLAFYGARRQGFGRSRLRVDVLACPPDARRRDLDNLGKAVLDALAHARVYEDDSQIDDFRIHRGPQKKGEGMVVVEVWKL